MGVLFIIILALCLFEKFKQRKQRKIPPGLQLCGDCMVEGQRMGGLMHQGVDLYCGDGGSQAGVEQTEGRGWFWAHFE